MRSFDPAQDLQSLAVGTSAAHGPPVHIRDAMEAQRLAWRRTPEAEYPSGYLGSLTSRREDRISEATWRQQKSYTRGPHKGEKLPLDRYLWTPEFNLASGIENQVMTGQRYVGPGIGAEPVMLTNDGKPGPARNPNGTPAEINPDRAAQLIKLRPPWS
jgi:hypothetical protein